MARRARRSDPSRVTVGTWSRAVAPCVSCRPCPSSRRSEGSVSLPVVSARADLPQCRVAVEALGDSSAIKRAFLLTTLTPSAPLHPSPSREFRDFSFDTLARATRIDSREARSRVYTAIRGNAASETAGAVSITFPQIRRARRVRQCQCRFCMCDPSSRLHDLVRHSASDSLESPTITSPVLAPLYFPTHSRYCSSKSSAIRSKLFFCRTCSFFPLEIYTFAHLFVLYSYPHRRCL